MRKYLRCWMLGAIAMALVAGCSGVKRPTLVRVSGTVKVNGKAVEGATVVFTPMEGSAPRNAEGTTDASGGYQLTTFDPNDGATLGKHAVTIRKGAAASGPAMSAEKPDAAYGAAMTGAAAGKPAGADSGEIPAKYGSPQTSGLDRTVTKEGPNKFDFDLK